MTLYKVFWPGGRFLGWTDTDTAAQMWATAINGYYQEDNVGGLDWVPGDCSSQPAGSHTDCSVADSPVANFHRREVSDRMVDWAGRALSLLEEALDWIGVVNPTEQEEALAHCLQRRIARLLAEVRQ